MLRARHDAARERSRARAEIRRESGAPDDDREEPWHARALSLLEQASGAVEEEDRDRVRELAILLEGAATPPLEDPGEYVGVAAHKGITVTFRVVTQEERQTHGAKMRDAPGTDDAVFPLMLEFIHASVAQVGGLEDEAGPYDLNLDDPHAIDILAGAGLVPPIYIAAIEFSTLTGEEKKTYGASPSTPPRERSPIASAIDAPPTSAPRSDVMAEADRTSPALSTSTTPVPDGSLSAIPGRSTPSISTEPPMAGSV